MGRKKKVVSDENTLFPDDAPPAEAHDEAQEAPKKKEGPEEDTPYPPNDGPRYTVGLQDPKDPCCYKDFYETENKGEAEAVAEGKAKEEGRDTVVWDRKMHEFCHRVKVPKPETEEVAKPGKAPKVPKITRK